MSSRVTTARAKALISPRFDWDVLREDLRNDGYDDDVIDACCLAPELAADLIEALGAKIVCTAERDALQAAALCLECGAREPSRDEDGLCSTCGGTVVVGCVVSIESVNDLREMNAGLEGQNEALQLEVAALRADRGRWSTAGGEAVAKCREAEVQISALRAVLAGQVTKQIDEPGTHKPAWVGPLVKTDVPSGGQIWRRYFLDRKNDSLYLALEADEKEFCAWSLAGDDGGDNDPQLIEDCSGLKDADDRARIFFDACGIEVRDEPRPESEVSDA